MDFKFTTWEVAALYSRRSSIRIPEYQRNNVWTQRDKAYLIDSILRGYPIPAIYMHKAQTVPEEWHIIDGQQRTEAIWGFIDNKFPLPRDMALIGEYDLSGLRFTKLPQEFKDLLYHTDLQIVMIEPGTKQEVADMFQRLQFSKPLTPPELRHADADNQMRNFVAELAKHPFFASVSYPNTRYQHENAASQMVLFELKGEPTNTRSTNLAIMYNQYAGSEFWGGKEGKALIRNVYCILDLLASYFPTVHPGLKLVNSVALYEMISTLSKSYDLEPVAKKIGDWYSSFFFSLIHNNTLPINERSPQLTIFSSNAGLVNSSAHAARISILMNSFFSYFGELETLPVVETNRTFSTAQRIMIYYFSRGHCQACRTEISWNNWHADHVVPFEKLGRTVIENGQALCPTCNRQKSNKAFA